VRRQKFAEQIFQIRRTAERNCASNCGASKANFTDKVLQISREQYLKGKVGKKTEKVFLQKSNYAPKP